MCGSLGASRGDALAEDVEDVGGEGGAGEVWGWVEECAADEGEDVLRGEGGAGVVECALGYT